VQKINDAETQVRLPLADADTDPERMRVLITAMSKQQKPEATVN
jgi:hypothetical protein